MESNIGKRVRILPKYDRYKGMIGTVIRDNGVVFGVKLENGTECSPYAPHEPNGWVECEFIEEAPIYPEYKVGQRVYVHSGANVTDDYGEQIKGSGTITYVDKKHSCQPNVSIDMDNGEKAICYPYPDDGREFNVEILPEESKNEKRYVRCTDSSALWVNEGEECELIGEAITDSDFWEVIDTGGRKQPLNKKKCTEPYTKTPESKYRYDKIKDKQTVVHCSTQEEWDKVTEICGYNWSHCTGWQMHRSNTAISLHKKEYGMCKGGIFQQQNYQIISAKEFIQNNTTQTTNMDKQAMKQQLETLQKQIKALQEQIDAPDYLPIGTIVKWTGIRPVIGKIVARNGENYALDVDSNLKSYDSCNYKYIERATPAEIEEYNKPKSKVVTIGSENTKVTVDKGKITGPDGKDIEPSDLQEFIDDLEKEYEGIPWTITIPKITIGCAQGITVDQLKQVMTAYKSLNS